MSGREGESIGRILTRGKGSTVLNELMYILSLMSFIKSRTSAKFYGESQMTFLVQKDCVDIIFKIKKGVYLTVSVYSFTESRLLLACS